MEYRRFPVGQRLQLELCRAPPIQRAFIAQHLILHKAHGGTAQNQINPAVLPLVIDDVLEPGGNGLFRFRQVWVLVYDEYHPLLRCQCSNGVQRIRIAAIGRGAGAVRVLEGVDCLGERLQIFLGGRI